MKVGQWLLATMILCVGLSFFASSSFCADVYHGRVVDEETGEPLAGASVTVVWYRTPIVQLEGSLYFQSAQETVTDAEGKFSLEVTPGIDWNPFTTVVREHRIVIYQPGYWPFTPSRIPKEFWVYKELVTAFKNGALLKLTKCKTKEEVQKCVLESPGLVRVPDEKIPYLIRNINLQRKLAGLSPLLK
jgi:hypothetical protein